MTFEMGWVRQLAMAVGGLAAVLGLYWDDAWHTDVGRDAFFSPPHLVLYAGVTVLLLVALSWARDRWRSGGWPALRDPLLLLPLGGAALTLAAAPVDELWHQLFGRDAVVWSPPHMVAVAGLLAFAAGLLLTVARARGVPRIVPALLGAFVIAAAVTPVMEFEADVPQFPLVWYWPVLLGGVTLAFALIRRVSQSHWAATEAAAIYLLLRLLAVGFLASLGHSLPTVMPTIAGAVVMDVLGRRRAGRAVIAMTVTAAVGVTHSVAHGLQGTGLTIAASDLSLGVLMAVPAAWASLAAVGLGRPARSRPAAVRAAASALLVVTALLWGGPALAHDPGQGEDLAPVALSAVRDGETIHLRLDSDGACTGWVPGRVVARRAGRISVGDLVSQTNCRYEGTVTVDDPGRWFLYAEVVVDGRRAEAWIPVDGPRQAKETALYATPGKDVPTVQVGLGILLYLVVVAVITVVARLFRRHPAQATGAASGETVPRNVYR